ncbi:phosphoglycolate phosphatase [Limnohabitans sp.]|uniref:phosphoglycolate phosphatase n=1 Tax=Limnohabitans sp. TaxID=1907725 RepID=UPI00286F3CBC|nr:phosphoglycolate phosphatase [Limnohabitans sp.]
MMYRAVFFDLDGTLVETAPEIADAVNDTLAYFDWPAVSQTLVDGWIGHGTQALLVEALAHVMQQSVPEVRQSAHLKDALPVFDRYYQARCGTRSHLYPHVRDALAHLRAQGIKLALVTNKEGRYTQTVLQVHQLKAMFDAVVSGDTLRVKKPNPSAVELHLKKWGVNKENALFVGDSSIDAATARNAGIAVWLLPYGYNMSEPVAACQPDRVISDVSELMNL